MKKRKLKSYVLPTIYGLAVCAIFASILFLTDTFKAFSVKENHQRVINPIVDNALPVVQEIKSTEIIKPYYDATVAISKNYYSKDSDQELQQKSLIYYQNTYMQSSGILYTSSEMFDVVAVLDGKISNIKEDDLLGNIVEIEHQPNLITSYYCLSDIKVSVGDEIKQGDVIGLSGSTNINDKSANNLLFEVNLNGKIINPEDFYTMSIDMLNQNQDNE